MTDLSRGLFFNQTEWHKVTCNWPGRTVLAKLFSLSCMHAQESHLGLVLEQNQTQCMLLEAVSGAHGDIYA